MICMLLNDFLQILTRGVSKNLGMVKAMKSELEECIYWLKSQEYHFSCDHGYLNFLIGIQKFKTTTELVEHHSSKVSLT